MTAVAEQYLAAGVGILRRDLAIFFSYRLRLVGQVVTTLFSLVVFYYVSRLVTLEEAGGPDAYFAFVAVGLVIFGILTSTLGTGPIAVRQELVAGTFERLVVSPFGAVGAILSMMVFPFIYGTLNGVVTLVVAALLFDLSIAWSTAPLALPVSVLGCLAFLPFGVVVAAAVIVAKQAMSIGSFIVTGISLIAGLYFPVTLLPGWIEWAAAVQPFTPAVDLLRHLLVGTPLSGSPWAAVASLTAFAVVLFPLSVLALSAAVRSGRRNGTLTEY